MATNVSQRMLDSSGADRRLVTIARSVFALFLIAYAAVIAYRPHFGLVDDTMFLDSVLVGKWLPAFVSRASGRFIPLQSQEYSLVALVSATPFAFFLTNALEAVLTGWLLVRLGQMAMRTRASVVPYVAACCVMLSPTFLESWLRFAIPEREELIVLVALLLCALKFTESGQRKYVWLAALFGLLTLFYKETAFVLVGGIGLFHLLLAKKSRSRGLDLFLVSASAGWLVLYYTVIYRFRGKYVYASHGGSTASLLLRSAVGAVAHEPVLMLGLAMCAGIYLVRRSRMDPLFETLLLASAALPATYFALRMSGTHYLVPLYAFVPYIVGRIAVTPSWSQVFRKPYVLALFVILIVDGVIGSVQEVTAWKTGPTDFQATLVQLKSTIEGTPGRSNLFLGGMTRGSGIEYFYSVAKYLNFVGVPDARFDLKSDLPVEDEVTYLRVLHDLPQPDFSFAVTAPTPMKAGDLVLLTSGDPVDRRAEFADTSRYQLLYRTNSWAYRNIGLKSLARTVLHVRGGDAPNARIDPNFFLYRKLN